MYHVWNNDLGKFEDFEVSITQPFQLAGYIVVICSPQNIYLCHKDYVEICAKAVSILTNYKEYYKN